MRAHDGKLSLAVGSHGSYSWQLTGAVLALYIAPFCPHQPCQACKILLLLQHLALGNATDTAKNWGSWCWANWAKPATAFEDSLQQSVRRTYIRVVQAEGS